MAVEERPSVGKMICEMVVEFSAVSNGRKNHSDRYKLDEEMEFKKQMENNTTDNTPSRLSYAISIRQTQTSKIQNLVEHTHIPESAQITETTLPLLNPYTVFKRSRSFSRIVTALVQHRSPPIKEYVQSIALDNYLIPASTTEQYVDLEIGQPLIDQWIKEGSISLTYYPNFNIPLRDLNLHNCLKIQLQIVGASMMPNSYMATLHHQIAYRLQDHALDLPIPGHTEDTIFIKAEREDEVPTIIQIPKQLPREKLTDIMPLKWITDYEKAFQNITPVVATDTKFIKLADGSIQTTYEQIGTSATQVTSTSATETSPSASLVFQVLMIRPVTTEKENLIHRFKPDELLFIRTRSIAISYGMLTQKCATLTVNAELVTNLPFIQSTEVLPDGSLKQPSQAEQVLNWHTRNATVQNRVLHSIDQKIDQVSHHVSQHDHQLQHLDSTMRNMYTDLQSRVSRLDVDLHQYINQGYFGPEFDSKEREIRQLKDQLDQITRDHFTSTPYIPRPHPYSPSLIFPTQSPPPPSRPPDHNQFFKSTRDIFRKYPPLSTHLE
ncbi:hypothetical protein Ddye_005345 [Dipteronia dyeriana]|uniref:Uncharacterized protein n=1 Tax=Dipteronia dyeriana TaxID=168575 RepID=A0AAE0CPL8_9ROSI|nr:hypothetical protein Ddye_005345 [Dipteronia dyeriana]